jgi:hypothetical protein
MQTTEFDTVPTHLEMLCARYGDIPKGRYAALQFAIDAGANEKVLAKLCEASLTSRKDTIVLPAHRFENLSRGRGWARQGRGNNVQWGEKVDGGYRVGPGKWSVGATDGFSRKGSDDWLVEHVRVGGETWTIAS